MFSVRVIGALLTASSLTQAQVVTQRYCAVISTEEASGATGWYNYEIDSEGYAHHSLGLDLTGFTALPGSCDLSGGLSYHIHTFWNDTSGVQSGDNAFCSFDATGNHYDPYLACGPNTEEATSCTALGRVAPGYTYPCSPEQFTSGQYNYCEVGDTSGKFGNLFATDPDMTLFSEDVADPLPALIADYNNASMLSNQWVSVVVHCGSSRILCAKFLPVDDSASCGSYDSSSNDDDDTDLDFLDLSETEGALLWSAIIVVCLFGGILVGYKFLHSTKQETLL
jgi:hypothetical protein